MKSLEAVLSSVPMTRVPPPSGAADVMIGKFWRPLGPVSASHESLASGPAVPTMSIPMDGVAPPVKP